MDEPTKKIIYDLFFKMFQSYHFKQCLILSFASNYENVMEKAGNESDSNISSIGVQVLTSPEICGILLSNEMLRNNILRVLVLKLKAFTHDQADRNSYSCLWHILVDLKYMAR